MSQSQMGKGSGGIRWFGLGFLLGIIALVGGTLLYVRGWLKPSAKQAVVSSPSAGGVGVPAPAEFASETPRGEVRRFEDDQGCLRVPPWVPAYSGAKRITCINGVSGALAVGSMVEEWPQPVDKVVGAIRSQLEASGFRIRSAQVIDARKHKGDLFGSVHAEDGRGSTFDAVIRPGDGGSLVTMSWEGRS